MIKSSGNKQVFKPLHLQIADSIREQVYSNIWDPEERIPSENEFAAFFKVSRGTIQKALHALVLDGLLFQVKGKGTFIAQPSFNYITGNNLLSFAESLHLQGITFVTKVVEEKIIPADFMTSEKLQVPIGSNIFYLRRIRYVDQEPALLMESKMSLVTCPGLEYFDYTKVTLFSAIEQTSQRKIGYSKQRHGARVAGTERGNLLACDENAPVLHLDQVCYLSTNIPAEWGNIWLPANKYIISSVVQRIQ